MDYQLNAGVLKRVKAHVFDEVYTIRGEVTLMRGVLQSIVSMCNSDDDLVTFSAQIADMADKISKAVLTCQKVEEKSQYLIEQPQVDALLDAIMICIKESVTPEQFKAIALKIEAING